MRAFWFLLSVLIAAAAAAAAPAGRRERPLRMEPVPGARFTFGSFLERRLDANVRGWLIPAPAANPGMLEMFQVRDRQPTPKLVPWAGEFAGKYLISAVQALRMSEDSQLRATTGAVVRGLIAGQAPDGYLGPFPKADRLRGNWDLWGHYHCMLGLLLWHEQTGDAAALRAARRAGDLICGTYLDTGRRVFDAGSHEMNMAVIHGLGRLYRLTGEPRYFRMMREIEQDWERAGDYLRSGLDGREFFETPRPRWESLHDLQGLVELYQITGEEQYRQAFEHHWRSILRWDRRNTGGFSSGEQATGDPYANTAIETCCTVAWMALTLDMLRLTGDSRAADEFELSLYNGGLGAQHPSGRWWTYSTPMDGVREASAHSIVFQARAGTPELNCCSVNGPRVLGMLSDWAVMTGRDGLTVNSYAPGTFRGKLPDGTPIRLEWVGEYPVGRTTTVRVNPARAVRTTLRFRVPGWALGASVRLNDKPVPGARPGGYLELDRTWKQGDRVTVDLPSRLRAAAGDRDALGKVSLYWGPLLLAYDQALHPFDADAIPAVDARPAALTKASRVAVSPSERWVVIELGGSGLRLCDFASAGAKGTQYRTWLPSSPALPPPSVTRIPRDGARIPSGAALFRWSGPSNPSKAVTGYSLLIAADPELRNEVVKIDGAWSNRVVLDAGRMARLAPGKRYWWGVGGRNGAFATPVMGPAASFTIDPGLPPLPEAELATATGPALLLHAPLAGSAAPGVGRLLDAAGMRAAAGPEGNPEGAVALDGSSGRIRYSLAEFPEEDFSVAVRFFLEAIPERRLGQVFSAWTAPQDDPLRLVIDGGKLYARIEAGAGYGTDGAPVTTGRWYTAVAVKEGARLTVYLDGKLVGSATVPYSLRSNSREVALGGNPRFTGNEFLQARFAGFTLRSRALGPNEIARALDAP